MEEMFDPFELFQISIEKNSWRNGLKKILYVLPSKMLDTGEDIMKNKILSLPDKANLMYINFHHVKLDNK